MDVSEPASTTAASVTHAAPAASTAGAAQDTTGSHTPRHDTLRVSTQPVNQASVFSPSKAREAVERSLALLAQQLRGEEESIRAAAEASESATHVLRADVALLRQKLSSLQQELDVERATVGLSCVYGTGVCSSSACLTPSRLVRVCAACC